MEHILFIKERFHVLRILEEHRKELLTGIHGYQKALDCLDYLVFQIKKHRKQEEL